MFHADRAVRALLGPAIVAAVLALSGAGPAHGEASVARMPAKFAGAFVHWGAEGRERTLQAWEKWLNRKPSSVLGVDFYAQYTWEDYSKLSWVPGIWQKLNPARNVVWSMPLTVKGTPLADVAKGLHDAAFEAAARAIAEAQPKAIIRLGWEMNLEGSPWFAKGQEADFIAAFRRVVGIFRRYSDGFKYDWCPGWGPQEMPADLAYPGDDVVDYIGLDVYDFKYEGSPAGTLGHALSESAVRPAMAPRLRRGARQAHELPGMGRRPVRRQSLLHPADARLVSAERRTGSPTPPISTSTDNGRRRSTTTSFRSRRSFSGSCSALTGNRGTSE